MLTGLLSVVFFSFIAFKKVADIGLILLVIWGVVSYFRNPKPVFSDSEKAFIGTLVFYFITAAICMLATGDELSSLDIPSRFLLWIPIYTLIKTNDVNFSYVAYSTAAGLLLTAGFAAHEVFIERVGRASVGMNAIEFGNACLMFGALLLGFAVKEKNIMAKIGLFGAILAGVFASFLSGSRGGWLGILVCIPCILFYYRKKISLKTFCVLSTVIIAVSVFMTLMLGDIIKDRVNTAYEQVVSYDKNNHATRTTSIGLRFEFWTGGLYLFSENPVFGVGSNGYREKKYGLVEDGVIVEQAAAFGSLHNQFIEALTKRGIVGFAGLLAILFFPMFYFVRSREHDLSISGICVVTIISVAGLTQHVFSHNKNTIIYATLISLLFIAIEKSKEQKDSDGLGIYQTRSEIASELPEVVLGSDDQKEKERA